MKKVMATIFVVCLWLIFGGPTENFTVNENRLMNYRSEATLFTLPTLVNVVNYDSLSIITLISNYEVMPIQWYFTLFQASFL